MNPRRVFIIEDNPILSEIFDELLQELGFETDIIQDGTVALEKLNATPPDLVILDIHMPNVSGIEILHHIRTHEDFAKTRVIVVTADIVRAQRVQEQADFVFTKPVTAEQLLEKVQEVLR